MRMMQLSSLLKVSLISILILMLAIATIIFIGSGTNKINAQGVQVLEVKSRKVTLSTPLPEEQAVVMPLLVKEEDFNNDTTLNSFGFDRTNAEKKDWPPANYPFETTPDTVYYLPEKGNLIVTPTGQLSWHAKGNDNLSPIEIGHEKVVQEAKTFIEAHGGMPEDAEVWRVRGVKDVNLDFSDGERKENPVIVAYYIDFKRKPNKYGMRLSGEQDMLKVKIDSSGIVDYYRFWREPVGLVGEKRKVIAARQALDVVAENADRLLSKSGIGDDFKIDKVELVWWSDGPWRHQKIAQPAWAFKVSAPERGEVYVDAFTGQLLKADRK